MSKCTWASHISVSYAIEMANVFTQPFFLEREMQGSTAPHSVAPINPSLTLAAGSYGNEFSILSQDQTTRPLKIHWDHEPITTVWQDAYSPTNGMTQCLTLSPRPTDGIDTHNEAPTSNLRRTPSSSLQRANTFKYF